LTAECLANFVSLAATAALKPKTKEPSTPKSDLSDGVSGLTVQDATKVKSKNLDVVAEYKKVKRKNAANFVVIGR
jgi:elongation factor 1 alpha-like protein